MVYDYETQKPGPETRSPQPMWQPPKREEPLELDIEKIHKAADSIINERNARLTAHIVISVFVVIWFVVNAWNSDDFVLFILADDFWGFRHIIGLVGLWIVHNVVQFATLFYLDMNK